VPGLTEEVLGPERTSVRQLVDQTRADLRDVLGGRAGDVEVRSIQLDGVELGDVVRVEVAAALIDDPESDRQIVRVDARDAGMNRCERALRALVVLDGARLEARAGVERAERLLVIV
jgi:hypothetical protein